MLRNDVIAELQGARNAHLDWLNHAMALVEGVPVARGHLPIDAAQCQFGQWYYGKVRALARLPEFRAIEPSHDALHNTYGVIVRHLFGDEQDRHVFGWLDRWLGTPSQASEAQRAAAVRMLPELRRHSHDLIGRLEALELQLQAMNSVELGKIGIAAA